MNDPRYQVEIMALTIAMDDAPALIHVNAFAKRGGIII